MGWSDYPFTTLTIPQTAGPNDPQLFIGPPPAPLPAFYLADSLGVTLVGAILYKQSANKYFYQVNGYTTTPAGLAYVAYGYVDGTTVADVYEEYVDIYDPTTPGQRRTRYYGRNASAAEPSTLAIGRDATHKGKLILGASSSMQGLTGSSIDHSGTLTQRGAITVANTATLTVAATPAAFGLVLADILTYTSTVAVALNVPVTYPRARGVIIRWATGSGGGGGGAALTAAGQAAAGGGGGGGLTVQSLFIPIASWNWPWSITVGAAGTAGAIAGNGGNGGDTTVLDGIGSTIVLAPGGTGGEGAPATAAAVVTQGGESLIATAVGDIIMPGSDGGNGVMIGGFATQLGNGGAAAIVGGNRRPSAANAGGAGLASPAIGSGGSGGFNQAAQATGKVGGAGALGIVVIEIYL